MNTAKKLGMITASIISNAGAGGTCSICKQEFTTGEQLICFETGSYHGPELEGLKGVKGGVAHLNCLSRVMGGEKILAEGIHIASLVTGEQGTPLIEFAMPFGTVRLSAEHGCEIAFKMIIASAYSVSDALALSFLRSHRIADRLIAQVLITTRQIRHERVENYSTDMRSRYSIDNLFEAILGVSLDIFLEQSKQAFNLDSAAYLQWQESRGDSIIQ